MSGGVLAQGVVIVSLMGIVAGCGESTPAAPEPSGAAAPSSTAASATGAAASSGATPESDGSQARTPEPAGTASPGSGRGTAPVLGSSTSPNTTGYGSAQPGTIDGGQDSSGIVSGVTWSNWGAAQAQGTGTASYTAPGKPLAEGVEEKATVVAADLGECGGTPAYRKLTWYFPQHGETLDLGKALAICPVGQ